MGTPEEILLLSDELEVVVLPGIGCRLHRLRAFGVDLLRTPPDPTAHADDPFFWGGYVLAPWTNRVSAAAMMVAGRRVQLPANFPDGTAIHGQVFDRAWTRTGDATFRVDHHGDGWPWAYRVTAQLRVDGPRLELLLVLENRSDGAMPAGLGLHPWFVRPVEVALRARRVHPRNDDPAAADEPAIGPWALEAGHEPRAGLDATWLEVEPPAATLRWPSTGLSLTIAADCDPRSRLHVAVARPDDPEAVAVEPVTHVPWALDRLAAGDGEAMPLLAPGGTLALRVALVAGRDVPA